MGLPEKTNKDLAKSNQAISRIKTDEAGNTSISLYKDSPLREETYKAGKEMLRKTYTNVTPEMAVILLDQLKEKGFTNKRFMDAVKFVINNHKYPTITPADILSYDKVLNLRTYQQVSEEQKSYGQTIWQYYKPINIKGSCYYVNIREAELEGIEIPEYTPPEATSKTKLTGEYRNGKPVPKKQFNILEYYDKLMNGEIE